MARTRKPVEGERNIIPFGSPEHRALLGIDRDIPPERRVELEKAFKADPKMIPIATGKDIPWVSQKGERLPGGWVRKGR